jgi:hypothetical protein
MTQYTEGGSTANIATEFCPVCEPDRDIFAEILAPQLCIRHRDEQHDALTHNPDDASITSQAYMSGTAEAGGFTNREWCSIIHRDAPDRERPAFEPVKRKQ